MKAFADFNRDAFQRVTYSHVVSEAKQRGLSISARDLVTAVICFDSSDVIDQVIASHACTGDLGKQWRVQRMQ